jgi:hypothetical protein
MSLLPLLTAFVLAAAPAMAAPELAPVSVTNATQRLAVCTIVVDGRMKYEVKIRPGKTWSDEFQTIREVKLVCERSRELFFGPLKLGGTYRIYELKRWLEIEAV